MKVKILVVLSMMLLLISCNQGKIDELNEKAARLEAQNQQLMQENNSIKLFVEEVSQVIESVGEDLDKIVETEIDIREMAEGATPASIESELKTKLGAISQYIVNSKERIGDLEKQLSASKHDLKGVRSMLNNLKTQLKEKEGEVATLMQEVGMLQADVEKMGIEITEKEETIAEQELVITEANKRYYIVDKAGSLQEKGIIQKKGGFLFFGKTTTLSPNLNTEYFNVLDVLVDLDITIPYKMDDLKIVSPHEPASYQMIDEGEQTTLKIIDPAQFWEATKCLVIIEG